MKNKIPPPVITLLFTLIARVIGIYFPFYPLDSTLVKPYALILIVLGLSLDVVSFINFVRNKTTVNPIKPNKASKLVESGFYRFSRNPMYLGMLLLLTGITLLLGELVGLIVIPLFIFTMNYLQIIPEEKALSSIFRDSYEAYKKRVRRWI